MDEHDARQRLLMAALNYTQAQLSYDFHPDDPHGDAALELASEMLNDAVSDYQRVRIQ